MMWLVVWLEMNRVILRLVITNRGHIARWPKDTPELKHILLQEASVIAGEEEEEEEEKGVQLSLDISVNKPNIHCNYCVVTACEFPIGSAQSSCLQWCLQVKCQARRKMMSALCQRQQTQCRMRCIQITHTDPWDPCLLLLYLLCYLCFSNK